MRTRRTAAILWAAAAKLLLAWLHHVVAPAPASVPCSGTAYVHLGPLKTASTSIQRQLVAHTHLSAILQREDGVVVPNPASTRAACCSGEKAHAQLAMALQGAQAIVQVPRNETLAHFAAKLRHAARARACVFLSAEELSRPYTDLAGLADVLRPMPRVRFLVVYRRLTDWLASWHNQLYGKQQGSLAGFASKYVRLVDWLRGEYANVLASEAWAPPLAARFTARFGSGSVLALNMHALCANCTDILEELVCAHMPAPRTCAAARLSSKAVHANPSSDLQLLDVLMHVVKRGDVPRAHCQVAGVQKTLKELRGLPSTPSVQELGLECLRGDALGELRARAMQGEAALLPQWHTREAFEQAFDADAGERHTLCSVDAAALDAGKELGGAASWQPVMDSRRKGDMPDGTWMMGGAYERWRAVVQLAAELAANRTTRVEAMSIRREDRRTPRI